MRSRTVRGLALSQLGLGGGPIGNGVREVSEAEVEGAIAAAWDAGIRYFDTAPHYGLGLSERRMGRYLASYPRDDYVLSTKVGRLLVPTSETAARSEDDAFRVPTDVRRVWDFTRDGVLRSITESLDRLSLDRVDVVYLHDPEDHWEVASTSGADTLVELRDQGVVGAIGVGTGDTSIATRFVERCDLDVVMIAGAYTLLDQSAGDALIPAAVERGVAIVAAAVYNSGALSRSRMAPDALYNYGPASPEVRDRADRLADLCERHGATLPDAAIQFPLRNPAVSSVVFGALSASEVAQAATRYARELPDGLWSDLEDSGLIRA